MSGRQPGPPRWLSILALPGLVLVGLPVVALLWRAPWSELGDLLGGAAVAEAFWLSLVTSTAAAAVAVVVGLPLAWVQARIPHPLRRVVRAVVLLPLVLPPVVGGVALLLAFGRQGVAGRWLDATFGITLPFSPAGVVLAQAFVALPFLILSAEAGFRAVDPRLEDAARSLGAGRWTVVRRITLPLARPALVAGAVLAWARALGEFGATITFAGNIPGETRTLPLAVFAALERDTEAAIALSLLLVAVSAAVLFALRDRWLRLPEP